MTNDKPPEWGKTSGDGMYLHVTFKVGFVADLKKNIPAKCREWSKTESAWWIQDDWQAEAAELCGLHFGEDPT
jgi:hypothetical protein